TPFCLVCAVPIPSPKKRRRRPKRRGGRQGPRGVLAGQSKPERVLKLLERGPFLEEERERAREIKGFGSFNLSSASRAVAQPPGDDGGRGYGRSNSQYEERWQRDDGGRGYGRSNSRFEERYGERTAMRVTRKTW
ncbi:uncharacterized protein LOC120653669, partial [Panicum virgatum]|uniref:uncharacterized protein LOC120653669 n=1 Tax=Panicum virgatum TaxID=38727 RepID=UPI0019D5D104